MMRAWGTRPFLSCSQNAHSKAFSPSLPWPGCKCVLSLGIWHLGVQGKQHCIVMQIIPIPSREALSTGKNFTAVSSGLMSLQYRATRADRVLHFCFTQHPLSTVFFFSFFASLWHSAHRAQASAFHSAVFLKTPALGGSAVESHSLWLQRESFFLHLGTTIRPPSVLTVFQGGILHLFKRNRLQATASNFNRIIIDLSAFVLPVWLYGPCVSLSPQPTIISSPLTTVWCSHQSCANSKPGAPSYLITNETPQPFQCGHTHGRVA